MVLFAVPVSSHRHLPMNFPQKVWTPGETAESPCHSREFGGKLGMISQSWQCGVPKWIFQLRVSIRWAFREATGADPDPGLRPPGKFLNHRRDNSGQGALKMYRNVVQWFQHLFPSRCRNRAASWKNGQSAPVTWYFELWAEAQLMKACRRRTGVDMLKPVIG